LDTLREYAQEQLKARGGAGTADEAHATFYRELALRATLHIQGEQSTAWLTMLALDHDNLRVALAWFLGQPDGGAGAIDITNILQVLWRWRGEYHEARHWIPQVLDHSRGLASEKHIHLLMIAGSAAAFYGDRDTALDWFTEGLDLCRDVAAPLIESDLLINMGRIYCYRGDFVHGCALSEAALVLSRKTEDPLHLVRTIRNLAAALCGGLVNIERGMALFEEGLIIARATVDSGAYSQVTLAIFLIDFGSYLALTNQHTRAAMLLAEALALAEQNDHAIARVNALGSLGFLALLQSDRATACRYFLDSQQLINGISAPMNTVMNIEGLAEVAAEKHPRLAIQLLAATSAARTALDMQIEPIEQRHRAQVLADLRHELGDEEFSIAWYQGQDWTVEQALAAARTDTGEKQG